MGAIWILFIPFLVIIYASSEKKIKRLNKRIRRLEKQVKGNQDMSRLLEELKGQTVTVTVNGFGTKYEMLDIDEDWVKLTRVINNQQSETKLVRIEDIQGVQLYEAKAMILKNRLKELRARDGLNQSELAKLAGVSRQSISLLERGEYTPSVIIAITIAQIFKEPVENVFSLVEGEE